MSSRPLRGSANPVAALRRRLAPLVLGVATIYLYGVAGYMLFGFDAYDATAMTILTVTTVGFSTPGPLSLGERIFTASLALLGVSGFLALLAVLGAALAEGEFTTASRRRRLDRQIDTLEGHYIVCAYGRVGRTVARELEGEAVPFVVVETKEDLEALMRQDGVLHLVGDPTSEGVLRRAGVDRARGVICAVDSDAANVYICLTARSLNPRLFIVARASEPESPDRLFRAGADRVVSPYVTSGRHMALLALRPRVVDYVDVFGLGERKVRLDELLVEEGSPLAGRTLAEVCGEAVALLIQRADGTSVPNPASGETVRGGDVIVLFGEPQALRPIEGG